MTGLANNPKRFGFKSVNAREEQKAIGRVNKKAKKTQDDWGIDAQDALFVPILSNTKSKHLSNLKGFSEPNPNANPELLSERQLGRGLGRGLGRELESGIGANASNVRAVGAESGINKMRVGIYSTSANYCQHLEQVVMSQRYECNYFGLSQALGPMKMEQALSIDIWVVNLADDDETLALDEIMEICAEKTTLFLVEKEPTPQCINKLQAFLEAA